MKQEQLKTTGQKPEESRAVEKEEALPQTLEGDDVDEELRKQFHPAFCSAMRQTLGTADLEKLDCRNEYNLNTMPNRIDFLACKKDADTELRSGIAKIFRKHNLFEYKSPGQALGIAEYHLGMGYSYLYLNYETEVNMDEVTLSFVREGKPIVLMNHLRNEGFEITEYEAGIYHVRKKGHIDMQILVTREMSWEYTWLKVLTDRLTKEDAEHLVHEASKVKDELEKIRVRSILDLVSILNKEKEWMKRWNGMGAFRDLFKEEFEEKDQKIQQLSEQLQNQSEQLQSKDKQLQDQSTQLQNQDKQLKTEKAENTRLRQEIDQLKKQLQEQMNKIAML